MKNEKRKKYRKHPQRRQSAAMGDAGTQKIAPT
jgi:hypothetical protein